tara:strand:+ start:1359 stop:2036 length:678 start_codon:yes stop_codon:yes gene_type:complete
MCSFVILDKISVKINLINIYIPLVCGFSMTDSTDWREAIENSRWKIDFEINHYGDLFYSLIRTHQPGKVVELGTKAGYSAYHMAHGLRENGIGGLDCYDLWENYEFNSCPKSEAEANLREFIDAGIVRLHQRNVDGLHNEYDSIDILNVDLGNHADLLEEIVMPWLPKVKELTIIEGGSVERDQVDWMEKYAKRKIKPWLDGLGEKGYKVFTFEPFPSVSLIKPK